MLKLAKTLFAFALLLGGTGCMDIVELREQTFVVGLGIDLTANEELELSLLEVKIDNERRASSDPGNADRPYIVKASKGRTVAECLRTLRTEHFKELSLRKVSFIVFGEKAAKKGLAPYKDFLMRSNEIDLAAQLFVTRGSVRDMFSNDQGSLLEFTTKGFHYLPTYIPSYLWQLLARMESLLVSSYLNEIEVGNGQLQFKGEYLMRQDKARLSFSYQESRGQNILSGKKAKNIPMMLDNSGHTTFLIKKVQRRIDYAPQRVVLHLQLDGVILESLEQSPMATRDELEQTGAAFITQKLRRLLDRCHAEGIDIIGIGEAFRQRGWNTADWPQQLRQLPVDLQVRIRILDGQALKD